MENSGSSTLEELGLGEMDSVEPKDYISASLVDSDDEASIGNPPKTLASTKSLDAVQEVLSKPSEERTDEDIERVMDVLQYLPVFSDMTSNVRRAIFQVLMLSIIENEHTVFIDNGEEVKNWYVVLNGQLKLLCDSDEDKTYYVGDWFGVGKSLNILPHRGRLVSATKDCAVGYVSVRDYSHILTQGEENMRRVVEEGKVVAVLERRAVDAKREGYFIVQATPEKLLENLLKETVDERFHQDFLLTYRTFLKSPTPIAEALRAAWVTGQPEQRERITVIVLYWVTEHFSDFEGNVEMTYFLDWFDYELLDDGRISEKRALDKAWSLNARIRNIEMDRAGVNSPLSFDLVGGWEVGHPIFVSAVEPNSIPEQVGVRVGDQILMINEVRCDKRELNEVLSILRKNFKLSLQVRSNFPEFKRFVLDPPKPPPKKPGHAASADLGHHGRILSHMGPRSAKPPKIFKPIISVEREKLKKLKISSSSSPHHGNLADGPNPGPLKAKERSSLKLSREDLLESDRPTVLARASTMEDIHTPITPTSRSQSEGVSLDAVVKLYISDHSHKYFDISPTTSIAELISKGVKEFFPDKFIVSPADEYCILMVTVQSRNGPIRNACLPNNMTDLANFIGLGSRYYLKERAFHGTIVQDEEAEHMFKESREWEHILSLSPKQVAEELTRQHSEMFSMIDAKEYICDLWKHPDPLTKENLSRFENIPNDEMYWVVTTVVCEPKSDIRAKIIKHFIEIAMCCEELKNYNAMIFILKGLDHVLVQRMQSTWEKVPSKHRRNMENLLSFMNPSLHMAKYRELQRKTVPPLIPYFPIIKEDLRFLYMYYEHKTQMNSLVNFEKLRMLSQQIRVIKTYCQQTIMPEPPQIDLSQKGVLKRIQRSIKQSNVTPTMAIYRHHRMMKMVRKHLARKYVIQDEYYLELVANRTDPMVQIQKIPPPLPISNKRKQAKVVEIRESDLKFMEKVGSGGFGSVWKGQWKSKKMIVAIKTLVDIDEREVNILNSLNHPCITQFYGVVMKKPSCYIVTEFAENGSIFDYIHKKQKQPSLMQSLQWAREVAEGMSYLHDLDIIHRDLKSSNVVLASELKAKICDLGSARRLNQTVKQTTVIGTYAWMAPEMMRRDPVSKLCDVYSYGIFVWELVTWKQPFSDVFPPFMVMPKVAAGEHPPIPVTCEAYLAKLLTECWQMDASVRPSFEEILVILNTGVPTAK